MTNHDLKPAEFADIYAQTLAYGMFDPRLLDPSLEDFTRQEAAELIPRDTPVMCVIGNPPYSGESANKGEWIGGLMEDYKKNRAAYEGIG